MSTLAYSRLPYWRWWRYVRRRRATAPGTRPAKPWNGLVTTLVVSGLIALDQGTKYVLTTPDWAWHIQPDGWLIYPLIACGLAAALMLAQRTRLAGMLLMAGAVGNGGSEALHDRVANPLLTQSGTLRVAFNVADIYVAGATIALAYVVATLLVHHYPRRQPTCTP